MIVEIDSGYIGYCSNNNDIGDFVTIVTEDDYGVPINIPGTIVAILEN
jgi:hypothetical protein